MNELIDEFVIAIVALSTLLASCHGRSFPNALKVETRLTGRVCERLDTPMINI
jgi:hypothetical protein